MKHWINLVYTASSQTFSLACDYTVLWLFLKKQTNKNTKAYKFRWVFSLQSNLLWDSFLGLAFRAYITFSLNILTVLVLWEFWVLEIVQVPKIYAWWMWKFLLAHIILFLCWTLKLLQNLEVTSEFRQNMIDFLNLGNKYHVNVVDVKQNIFVRDFMLFATLILIHFRPYHFVLSRSFLETLYLLLVSAFLKHTFIMSSFL